MAYNKSYDKKSYSKTAPIERKEGSGMIANPSTFQAAIFRAFQTTTRNLAIDAVAGSGKTSTIVHIANLVPAEDRMSARFMAFSKAIQMELESRLPKGIGCGTFHATGKSIIEMGLGIRTHREWVNQWKYKNIAESLTEGLDLDRDTLNFLVQSINYTQLGLVDIDNDDEWTDMLSTYQIEEFHFGKGGEESTMRRLTRQALEIGLKQARNGECIDFNDMVWIPAYCPEIRRQKYDLIIVDEAQDLNPCQRTMILSIMAPKSEDNPNGGRMVIVGDPKQAIFGFAGADSASFPKIVTALDAVEMPLSVSYRCPSSHIALAQSIVPKITASDFAKEGVIQNLRYDAIQKLVDPKSSDMVISRVTAPLVTLAFELLAAGIPAKIKGREIMEQIVNLAKQANGKSDDWQLLGTNLDVFLEKEYARLSRGKNNEMKIAALQDRAEALEIIWRRSLTAGVTNLAEFKNWVKSVFDETINGAVILSTIHKAKGLEAERVFILDPSKMPHPMAKTKDQQEQEMNLKYVALTRSKSELYIVAPKPKDAINLGE